MPPPLAFSWPKIKPCEHCGKDMIAFYRTNDGYPKFCKDCMSAMDAETELRAFFGEAKMRIVHAPLKHVNNRATFAYCRELEPGEQTINRWDAVTCFDCLQEGARQGLKAPQEQLIKLETLAGMK